MIPLKDIQTSTDVRISSDGFKYILIWNHAFRLLCVSLDIQICIEIPYIQNVCIIPF